MDGYAVLSSSHRVRYKPVKSPGIKLQGVAAAGHPFEQPLKPEHAVRIFTGAPVPEQADAIVIQENTKAQGSEIQILQTAQLGDHIRRAGEDVRPDALLLKAGHVMGPGDIAMLVAQGHTTAQVISRPRVAILPTGDELVEAGQNVGPGQIANSKRDHDSIHVRSVRVWSLSYSHCSRSKRRITVKRSLDAAEKSDLILTIGGVSVGDFDHVLSSIEETGTVDFWKVAIKPGKPLAFGHICSTPIIGLPGNPASAFVCFELFARPALLTLAGRPNQRALIVDAKLQRAHRQNPTRDQFLRGRSSKPSMATTWKPHQLRAPDNSAPCLISMHWREYRVVTVTLTLGKMCLLLRWTATFRAKSNVKFKKETASQKKIKQKNVCHVLPYNTCFVL